MIEGEWGGARGRKVVPRAARPADVHPDHIPGRGTACLGAPSPFGDQAAPTAAPGMGGTSPVGLRAPHPRPSIFTRRLKLRAIKYSVPNSHARARAIPQNLNENVVGFFTVAHFSGGIGSLFE